VRCGCSTMRADPKSDLRHGQGSSSVDKRPSSRRTSVATRMLWLAFVITGLTVIAVGAMSVYGVYILTRSEDAERLIGYRQLLADDLTTRMTVADRVTDAAAAAEASLSGDPAGMAAVLERAQTANGEHFDLFMLVGPTGVVVVGYPSTYSIPAVAGRSYFPRGLKVGETRFGWEAPTSGQAAGRLWTASRVPGPDGMVVLGRLRSDFVRLAVRDGGPSGAVTYSFIVDAAGRPVPVGGGRPPVHADKVSFAPDSPGARVGQTSAIDPTLGMIRGYYLDLTSVPGLGWRLIIAEPASQGLTRARDALAPAAGVAGAAVVIALLAVYAFSVRLVAPLRAFERRARDVAGGGYVRPVVVDRNDEVGQLADAFNEIGVRVNSLQDTARLLATAADPDEALDAILSAASHILHTGMSAVLLVDEAGTRLSLVRGRGLREPDASFSVSVDAPGPLSSAFLQRQLLLVTGAEPGGASVLRDLFGEDDEHSGVVAPLVVGDTALGVIVVVGSRKGFSEAQTDTLSAFSAQAAVAVNTSRLFEHEHTSRREAETLREVAEIIASQGDLAQSLDKVAALSAELLGMDDCAPVVRGRGELGLASSDDPEEERRWLAALVRLRPDGVGGLPSFEPLVVPDTSVDPDLAALAPHGCGSLIMIPLVQGMRVRGALVLSSAKRSLHPSSRHVALAGTIGKEVSLALDNAFLLQQARTRAANLETIFRISQAVSSSLQSNVVLNRVLDVVQKIFTAESVALMDFDPVRRTITTSMARGIANRELLHLSVMPGEDIVGRVFQSGTPTVYPNLGEVDSDLARIASAQGLHSMLAVPLRARERSIGLLVVYSTSLDAFSSEDRELLNWFGSQAALAIDTATLYGKEHHVASVLQKSILPEVLPKVAGLGTASFYLPAGAEAEIGGDYYDLFRAPDGRVVLAIGDVCGKGVQAATKTSAIKHSLRGMVAMGAGPAQALTEMNRLVAESRDPSDIVTTWVGFVDLASGEMAWADGGHPPALLRRAGTRGVERLEVTGPLLGAVPSAEYTEGRVTLMTGDIILMYTDGVTEARRGRQFFGEGRLRRALRAAHTAQDAVDGLLDALGDFCGGALRDDAAVLAVEFEFAGRGAPWPVEER
jgi:GAF domain-containing protein/HAMP domain-containing protein